VKVQRLSLKNEFRQTAQTVGKHTMRNGHWEFRESSQMQVVTKLGLMKLKPSLPHNPLQSQFLPDRSCFLRQ